MHHTRRLFLKTGALAAAASAFSLGAPAILHAADGAAGADDKAGTKYTLALIGCGWWGTHILRTALKDGHVKLVALCDVDPAQLKKCSAAIAKATSDSPKTYGDFRELIAKEKPQIVINATPDHWHPLITIELVRAGAHVYVEKPISHTVLEGAAMVKAARETDRVVQVGTHRRMSPHNISAREFIRSGKVGKIGMARTFVYTTGGAEKPGPNAEPPEGMNWDMWCGPAPLRPFNRKIHPLGFRHFLDYANGQLGDWGIHWIDQVLWIMEKQHPKTVFSAGGRPVKSPAINTAEGQTTDAPDHQIVTFAFDDLTMTWEHRQFAGDPSEKNEPVGCLFYGTNGVFHLGWQNGWTFYPTDQKRPPEHADSEFTGDNGDNIPELWRDFLDAIKNKRRPACDIEIGHRSTTAALLGMLSLKLGRSIRWDGENQTIPDDPEAVKLLRREYRGEWKYPV